MPYITPAAYESRFAGVADAVRRLNPKLRLRKCRQLHAVILVSSPSSSRRFLFNNLLSVYTLCGAISDAQNLFDRIPDRTLVSYNTMIAAYSKSRRHVSSALDLFREMTMLGVYPNSTTVSTLAQVIKDLRAGSAMHCRVVFSGLHSNVCVQTSLLRMYLGFGKSEAAERIFDEMPERDDVAWNSILFSRLDGCHLTHGLKLYSGMVREGLTPTACTFTILLSACRKAGNLDAGRLVHAHIIKSESPTDVPLQNALLDVYASCGELAAAELVFDRIDAPDLVSWNSLMVGFSDNGYGYKAMEAFVRLKMTSSASGLCPDEYTYAAVVSSTAALPSSSYGEPLHGDVNKTGWADSIYVGQALIGMYFANGEPLMAERVFRGIPFKDVVIWTEMVAGHCRINEAELAIQYFYGMVKEGHKTDGFSLSSAIKASAFLTTIRQGEMFHGLVLKAGYEGNSGVCGSLVDLYAKNGSLESSRLVFDTTQNPDLICWNTIIGGYGNHGNSQAAFSLFGRMVEQGLQPDHVTYISLLSTCSHCGLLERGRFYWFCMMIDRISPGLKHYTCMVKLLSRAGLLREAEEMIMNSPFSESSTELWRILLSSSVVDKDLAMGISAANQVLRIEPEDIPTHVLLSNLYASVGSWDAVVEMRRKIRSLLGKKEPGLSWTSLRNVVHVFSADDDCHPSVEHCRDELIRLQGNLKGSEILDVSDSGLELL